MERDYTRLYREIGLGTTIWSPLARGLLTGKYNDGVPSDSRMALQDYAWLRDEVVGEEGRRRIDKMRSLEPLAKDMGCTLAQMALAWCLKNPDVSTVITGASRLDQVTENMAALSFVDKLTPDVIERIEAILDNKPEPEPDFRTR